MNAAPATPVRPLTISEILTHSYSLQTQLTTAIVRTTLCREQVLNTLDLAGQSTLDRLIQREKELSIEIANRRSTARRGYGYLFPQNASDLTTL